VPTRPGSWHDLMNALVWATFPRAKRALHERQHRLVVPAAPAESARRPRELDALALLDEGGVVVLASAGALDEGDERRGEREEREERGERGERGERALEEAIAAGDATAFVFGHAIYEGLVLGRPAPLASVVVGTATAEPPAAAAAAGPAGAAAAAGPAGAAGPAEAVGAAGAEASSGMVELADRALAAVLADPARIVDPTDMLRLRADGRLLRAIGG